MLSNPKFEYKINVLNCVCVCVYDVILTKVILKSKN